jgi:hypothetical protein
MLTVSETIQEYKIGTLLAKETFDSTIAPIRAWAAQMELKGMKEGVGMGVKARLNTGKLNTGQDRNSVAGSSLAARLVSLPWIANSKIV